MYMPGHFIFQLEVISPHPPGLRVFDDESPQNVGARQEDPQHGLFQIQEEPALTFAEDDRRSTRHGPIKK
jgi:hypothetical protein